MTKPVAESRARTNRIGRHLPTSSGLIKTLQTARELELETVQIFVSNPQGWATADTNALTLTMVVVK
jgi:deoxyribonuclease-4